MSKSNVSTMKKRGFPVKVLCYTAVLTALSAVCNIFTIFLGAGNAFAVSFTYIPCFISGALLGPFSGFLTGILGDLIGCWIAPKGDINPIILLASGFLGLIPGIVFSVVRKIRKDVPLIVPTIISLLLVFAVCTNLNTIGLYVFYFRATGKTLNAVYILRLPKQLIIWSINFILCVLIVNPISKIINVNAKKRSYSNK